MKILIQILKMILNIMLIVAISLLIFTNLATSTILNKDYILNRFEKTGYYEKIKQEAQSSFENYIAQSGFDDNVMENIVSDEKIKNDTKTIITNIYDGTNTTIDTTEIEKNLRNNIEKSLGNTDLNITQQNAINQYVETICNQYKETISHTKYETNINKALNQINKYVEIAKKIALIATAILIILILIFNCKSIIRGISQIGIVLTSSGLLYIIMNVFIHSKIKIDNLLILNNAISEVIKEITTNILDIIFTSGTALLILGILIIFISNFINSRKDNKLQRNSKM